MARQRTKEKIQTIMDRSDSKISVNVEENYIFTTEDKIRIVLFCHCANRYCIQSIFENLSR